MGSVKYTEDSITLYDRNGVEIVKWLESEWIEDSQVVFSIAHAIEILLTDGDDDLKTILEQ